VKIRGVARDRNAEKSCSAKDRLEKLGRTETANSSRPFYVFNFFGSRFHTISAIGYLTQHFGQSVTAKRRGSPLVEPLSTKSVRALSIAALEAIMNTTQFVPLIDRRIHPPLVSNRTRYSAREDWLYNAAEELLRGGNVSFQRRMRKPQGVTVQEFALTVDEYVNNRLANSEVHTSALGWLIITAERGQADKTATAELLGNSDHPFRKLGEIAETLLEPLADDALIAKSEDEL
jgi:hypothetical protein